MQLRFNFGLLLILCCFQVAAKDSLDNLIKQQKMQMKARCAHIN